MLIPVRSFQNTTSPPAVSEQMRKEETSEIRKIAQICKIAMECIVSGHYRPLEDRNALSRTSEQDIRRVLKEYNPKELPVMPLDSYFEESADVYEYRDGSGWHVDIITSEKQSRKKMQKVVK